MEMELNQVLAIVKTGDIKAAEAAIMKILSKKRENLVKEATDLITSTLFEGDDKGEEKPDPDADPDGKGGKDDGSDDEGKDGKKAPPFASKDD